MKDLNELRWKILNLKAKYCFSLWESESHIRNIPPTVNTLKCAFSLLLAHKNESFHTDTDKCRSLRRIGAVSHFLFILSIFLSFLIFLGSLGCETWVSIRLCGSLVAGWQGAGGAPHVSLVPALQPRGGLQDLQPYLSPLSFPHPIIIHHQSRETYVLLFEIFLLLWQLFMSYFFYRALNMCKRNDVFSFVINLSMEAHFCTFLHVVLFSCKLGNDQYWNPCLKLKSQACMGNFFKPLSTERPCLHCTIFIVDAPVGEQRTNQAKTTWEGIKWSKKNKNISRGFFIKSLPALGNSQRSWKLKKDIWLEGQKAQWVSAMSLGRTPVWPAHSSCPWTFSLCYIGAGLRPALCWGCLCCHKGTGCSWYPTNLPLAFEITGDHLVFPRDATNIHVACSQASGLIPECGKLVCLSLLRCWKKGTEKHLQSIWVRISRRDSLSSQFRWQWR